MSSTAQQVANLVDMLPTEEQNLAFELIKKLVLAWDPDFTKLTALEMENIETAQKEIDEGQAVNHNDICWD